MSCLLIIEDLWMPMARSLDLQNLQQTLQMHLQTHNCCGTCELNLLAHGEANVIFQLNQTALVRVAVNTPNQRFAGDLRRLTQFEQLILQYLEGTEIGHVLQSTQLQPTDDFPYTYLITNYLPGESLDYSRSDLQKCAKTLAQLHRLPQQRGYAIDSLMGYLPVVRQPLKLFFQESQTYVQPYLESPDAEPEIVEMLHHLLKAAAAKLSAQRSLEEQPYLCLVHSDHTYENWVINDRQAHLIDWEWAEIGSPAGDLGHFLSPVTIHRRQGYRLPSSDRTFFLNCYYEALADERLITTIQTHFAAFGVYPAVRSLCWTAGYWVTANLWYEDAQSSPSAAERLSRFRQSREQFPALWREVMAWLEGGA
ncbi:MAG: phosphotransferase [Coleofasciculaceae cyanobacterium SM2_1_6]|nr:phosphotransferase [Coleofasciculaceae cyanobacterium SM2_1_6]